MMSFALRAALVSFVLSATALSASDPSGRIHPIPGPVRDGGIYHIVSQTWTRRASQIALGAGVIYKNNCNSFYFSPLTTDTYVDEGRIPSPTSPTSLNSRPGTQTSYLIDGFQIGYCTDQPTATIGTYAVNFYQSYVACSSVIGVTPTAGFDFNNLPGSTTGAYTCWHVTIDLDAPPLSASAAFTMLADGDGSYTGASTTNLFGWSMASTAPGMGTGPLIASEFALCSGYAGTIWETPVNYAQDGTGMGTLDQFRIEGGATAPGCYYGGLPHRSFWLVIYSNVCGTTPPGIEFCCANAACPCPQGTTGCPGGCSNSSGGLNRGTLTGWAGTTPCGTTGGGASLSHDTITLFGTGMPNFASSLYLQGTTQQNSGFGTAFGDGLRCVGGTIVRLRMVVNSVGTSQFPSPGDPLLSVKGQITTPGTRTYQIWYRDVYTYCTAATFNLSNGYEIAWGP